MGVDIHFIREKFQRDESGKGQWVTAETWGWEDAHIVPKKTLNIHGHVLKNVLSCTEGTKGIGERGYPADLSDLSMGWVRTWSERAAPYHHNFLLLGELRDLSDFINQGKPRTEDRELPTAYSVLYDAFQQPEQLNLVGVAVVEVDGWVKKDHFDKFEQGGSKDYSLIYPVSSYVHPSVRVHYEKIVGTIPLWFVVREELNKLIAWVADAGEESRVLMLKTN